MEEDAGKSLHEGFPDSDRKTYVDFNRSGVPLIEIVTEPDLRSAADAAAVLRAGCARCWSGSASTTATWKRAACAATPTCRCGRPAPTTLGTKAEVKNLNSFRYLQKALEYEIDAADRRRSRTAAASCRRRGCGTAAQAHRSRCAARKKRTTTGTFPEPDLPPLVVDAAAIDGDRAGDARAAGGAARAVRGAVRPARVRRRRADAVARELADYFEAVAPASGHPKAASNWIMGELRARLNERGTSIARSPVAPDALAGLIALVENAARSAPDRQGRVREDVRVRPERARDRGGRRASRRSATRRRSCAIVRRIVEQHADAVAQVTAGKIEHVRLPGRSGDEGDGGKANPKLVNELLKREIEGA